MAPKFSPIQGQFSLRCDEKPIECRLPVQKPNHSFDPSDTNRDSRLRRGGCQEEPDDSEEVTRPHPKATERSRVLRPSLLQLSLGYARSKRSRFITLLHAATKSFTNFSCESLSA